MYKLCKSERSAERQRLIEKTLLGLMKAKRFEEISVSEVCASISMPRKAFYRYFNGKEGALQALIDHTFAEFHMQEKPANGYEKRTLEGDLEQFFSFWLRRREMLAAFEKSNLTGYLIQSAKRYSLGDVTDRQKFLPGESEWIRSQVFLFAISGLMTFVLDWYQNDFDKSTKEMAQAACRMLSKPLFPTLDELGLLKS